MPARPIITQYKPRLPRNLAKTRALSSFKQDEENREVYLTQRPTSSPGLFPFKMGGAHPFFKGKALGTRLTQRRRRRQQERQTSNRFKLAKQQIHVQRIRKD